MADAGGLLGQEGARRCPIPVSRVVIGHDMRFGWSEFARATLFYSCRH
jgi:hypothetical protein